MTGPGSPSGERFARAAIGTGVEHEPAARGAGPPADPAFLALIVHALEDGLAIQWSLCPDDVAPGTIVDAVDLLIRSWAVLGATQDTPKENPSDDTP